MKMGIRALVVVCGVLAAASPLAAQRPRHRPTVPPRATPQPAFVLDSATIMAHGADFKAYVGGLEFDTSLSGADRRVLMQGPAPGHPMRYLGPKAELAPEIGAHEVTGRWAAWGRIVARITLWSDSTYVPSGYHFRLQPGVTYLAVRMVPGRPDSLMGFLIATASDTTVRGVEPVTLRVLNQVGPARFVLVGNDDGICSPCNRTICCPM